MSVNKIGQFFNWKKNPNNIFYIAIPLFIICFTSQIMVAYLHWKQSGNLYYALIILVALGILGTGLWPIRKFLWSQFNA